MHYYEPHDPYEPPDPYASRYTPRAEPGSLAHEIGLYDGGIRFTDAELGRLLEYMQRRALLDNTLIVVVGDHGEGLMDHGEMGHGRDVFEESMHVPLLMWYGDRLPKGKRIAEPVELTDLVPTLLAGLELTSDDDGPGVDLWPAMAGDAVLHTDRPIYLHRRHYAADDDNQKGLGEKFGVRVGDWKYVIGPDERTQELYNLRKDPIERFNVLQTVPDRAAELDLVLRGWMHTYMREYVAVPELSAEDREALEALGYIE